MSGALCNSHTHHSSHCKVLCNGPHHIRPMIEPGVRVRVRVRIYRGCGGCGWHQAQHHKGAQKSLKDLSSIVIDLEERNYVGNGLSTQTVMTGLAVSHA